jgi:hypothetical protein
MNKHADFFHTLYQQLHFQVKALTLRPNRPFFPKFNGSHYHMKGICSNPSCADAVPNSPKEVSCGTYEVSDSQLTIPSQPPI